MAKINGLLYEEDCIELWKVQGSPSPFLFPCKDMAETYARSLFPNETVDQRYAHIRFIRYFKEQR